MSLDPARRKARSERKEAWEMNAGLHVEVAKKPPFVKPPSDDVSRKEAQKRAVAIFGPRAFARKKSTHAPPYSYAIGIRKTVPPFQVVTIGSGKTWKEATEAAVKFAEKCPEVLG